jgi:DNA replication protein DnaC
MAEELSYMSEIMREYEDLQFRNRQLHNERVQEVQNAVPRINDIDEEIRDMTIDAALAKLHEEEVDEDTLRQKTRQLIAEKHALLVASGYAEDYLEPIYSCSLCHDTGYAGEKTCECLNRRMIERQYQRSNLGKNLAQENFSQFRSDYYSDKPDGEHKLTPRANIENVHRALLRYVHGMKAFQAGDTTAKGNLLFQGSTGVGKTFLSNCVAKELLDQGYTVLYVSAGSLFDQIADVIMNRNQIPGSREFYQSIQACDVLIIDDLGTEYTNSFTNAHLYDLINDRLLERKPMIISTNLSLAEIKEHYSERISSRIYDSYLILNIYGADIRLAKRRGVFQA